MKNREMITLLVVIILIDSAICASIGVFSNDGTGGCTITSINSHFYFARVWDCLVGVTENVVFSLELTLLFIHEMDAIRRKHSSNQFNNMFVRYCHNNSFNYNLTNGG